MPNFSKKDLVIIASPVYGGRLPFPISNKLRMVQGNGARTLALVVYGNRDYEDALLEMVDILSESKFVPIAAGAFIARHVFVPEIATDRPHNSDLAQVRQLADIFIKKAQSDQCKIIAVPGHRPYKNTMQTTFVPTVSTTDCHKCGACVNACPTGAIDKNNPAVVDASLCINCMRCVECCAEGLRDLPQQAKDAIRSRLSPLIGVIKPNEIFI